MAGVRAIPLLLALLAFAVPATPLGEDPALAVADCVSFGTTAQDARRPDVGLWTATTNAEKIGEDPSNGGRVYPGYGHPDLNDAGDRIEVRFDNRLGTELRGVVYLPPTEEAAVPLLFLEGLATNVELYEWWHLALADLGYVVFAFDFSGQGESEAGNAEPVEDAEDAITYLFEASPVAGRIRQDRLGVFGHSLGAITAMALQARDPRVKSVVAAAVIDERTTTFPHATIPVQIQSGDQDGPIAPYFFTGPFFAKGVYDQLTGPRQLVNIEGGTHAAHTNGPFLPSTSWSQAVALKYSAAWFDFFLRGDPSGHATLLSGDARLSDLWPSIYDLGGGETGALDSGGPIPACAQALA